MPPKQMLSKEDIIQSALDIAKKDGMNAVTARRLGTELGCSSRPIFTTFDNMEEVHTETIKAAKALYNQYVADGLKQELSFKGVGKQYIKFANEQPKLFQLLFMKENKTLPSYQDVLHIIDENNDKILQVIQEEYHLNEDQAQRFYMQIWIYTHGIATLIANRVCSFEENQINEMLGEVAMTMLKNIDANNQRLKEITNAKNNN